MKTIKVIAILMIVSTLFTGCDFFRSILGKPTSKEIERMRIEAEAKAKKQKQLDSINLIKAQEEARLQAEAAAKLQLNDKYYLIIGSFMKEDNAVRMYEFLEKNGYTPKQIKMKNGFTLVSAKSFNVYHDAYREMDEFISLDFCPEDVWIYGRDQKLHIE